MATTAANPVFVDTNILVYAAIPSSPFYGPAFGKLDAFRQAGVELWISRQILREYLSSLSRPLPYSPPLPASTLIADVIRFQSQFQIAEDGPVITANLLGRLGSIPIGGKQVHNANIVATMQTYGLRRLWTHNTADFTRFSTLIQIEPLVSTP
ncbi:MAG: type II toxin-antitoxin system VapC family toxin [Isosphaeraceae bacterium]